MIKFKVFLVFAITLPISANFGSDRERSKSLNTSRLRQLEEHNAQALFPAIAPARKGAREPYLEYDPAKYLLFSAKNFWSANEIKKEIAKNLPADVTLVIIAGEQAESEQVFEYFKQWVPAERLRVFEAPNAGGFWARDSLPIPIYERSEAAGGFRKDLNLVDARYYHYIEPDERVAAEFERPLQSHDYYFEGGNFLSDSRGNCMIVNRSYVQSMPDEVFYELYGCKSLFRFPHEKGIGHIDESVKLLSDEIALTDHEPYKKILEEMGYQVHLLPRPEGAFETYVNSLLVNGTLFVPIFNHHNDQQAIALYESFGFKVIPLNSKELSRGKGSIHCITMTYPEEYKEFLETTALRF